MSIANVSEYVAQYEFRGDQDYKPTENERALIEDALHGFLAEREEQERTRLAAIIDALQTKLTEAKINCDGSDEMVAYTQGVIDTYESVREATTASAVGAEAREAGRSAPTTPPVKTGEG